LEVEALEAEEERQTRREAGAQSLRASRRRWPGYRTAGELWEGLL